MTGQTQLRGLERVGWWLGMGTGKGSAALLVAQERSPQTPADASETRDWSEALAPFRKAKPLLYPSFIPEDSQSPGASPYYPLPFPNVPDIWKTDCLEVAMIFLGFY